MGIDDLGVKAVEGGEKGGVHLPRGNRFAAEALRARGAGISEEGDLVAQIGRLTHARIDAHVRHHARDDEVFDAVALERGFELRLAKAVWKVLLDDGFAFSR